VDYGPRTDRRYDNGSPFIFLQFTAHYEETDSTSGSSVLQENANNCLDCFLLSSQ
jgi:hypothetical protein